MSFRLACLPITLMMCGPLSVAGEGKPASDEVQFFENKIRPILVKHCYECHSADAKEIGGKLLLDSREGLRAGGEAGPALLAGTPENSLLLQAIRYDGLEMPPDEPLPEPVVDDFVKWIKRGAADPRSNETAASTSSPEDAESLWAFYPPNPQPVPDVSNSVWPQNDLDRFVLARIEAAGLQPTTDGSPRRLIRRLHIDLIGLPPTYEKVEDFVIDYEENRLLATQRLVDELLSRPEFGERWGRHWLDVARYGESNGNDGLGRNPTSPMRGGIVTMSSPHSTKTPPMTFSCRNKLPEICCQRTPKPSVIVNWWQPDSSQWLPSPPRR